MMVLRRDRKENGAGFFVARGLIAKDLVSNLDDALVWPAFLIDANDKFLAENTTCQIGTPNIARDACDAFARRLNVKWRKYGSNSPSEIGLNDIFNFIYAVFHSPGYRSRYADFLKTDFPRIPSTGYLTLFRALARLGGELVTLHLMETSKLDRFLTTYTGPSDPEVGRDRLVGPLRLA